MNTTTTTIASNKKDGNGKFRREFDMRVGNINKISSKIDDLLQFVKGGRRDDGMKSQTKLKNES